MIRLILSFLILCNSMAAYCQNKVVAVIGSSTAAGTGATTPDSSWVRRLSNHYKAAGILDTIYNRAKPGLNSYHGMPTSFTPPPSRPAPMPDSNITRAISLNPDVILITFVSNNFDSYSIAEIKTTLFTMFDSATAAGKVAFVSTTQPRTGFSEAGRLQLRKLKDSIIKWFGEYSINFWNPIADSSNNTIAAEYRYTGDAIHVNNAGHRVLFEQVLAKNIFDAFVLPIRLTNFTLSEVDLRVQLKWVAESDDMQGEIHVQKSRDGRNFETLQVVKSKKGNHTYTVFDDAVSTEKNYYRLAVHEQDRIFYSDVLSITVRSKQLAITSVYPVPAKNILYVSLTGTTRGQGVVVIMNLSGIVVHKVNYLFENNTSIIRIPVGRIAKGTYVLRIQYPGANNITQTFQKY